MKLWLLTPKKNVLEIEDETKNPWEPWYDKCFGQVVRAPSAVKARKIAAESRCSEGAFAWLDKNNSDCKELRYEGEEKVILREERWA